jgi:hypothetical protein
MLMTFSWFGHMDQQDCRNFFTTSTALDLPTNSQWKWILGLLGHEAESKTGQESVLETYPYWSFSALQVQPPTSYEVGSHS